MTRAGNWVTHTHVLATAGTWPSCPLLEHTSVCLSLYAVWRSCQDAAALLNAAESMPLLPQVATAPDGNGGVYKALKRTGMLQHMHSHGIRYVDCYSVDNAAARICEPTFIGACVEGDAQVGARVVSKATPGELVGVFARCRPPCLSQLLCYSGSSRPASDILACSGTPRRSAAVGCLHSWPGDRKSVV